VPRLVVEQRTWPGIRLRIHDQIGQAFTGEKVQEAFVFDNQAIARIGQFSDEQVSGVFF